MKLDRFEIIFDISGSKSKLAGESLSSGDHIQYWKCNIPSSPPDTQHTPTLTNNRPSLIESSNLKGFK